MTTPYKVTNHCIIIVSLYKLTLWHRTESCVVKWENNVFSLTSLQTDFAAFNHAVLMKAGLMENMFRTLLQVTKLVLTMK